MAMRRAMSAPMPPPMPTPAAIIIQVWLVSIFTAHKVVRDGERHAEHAVAIAAPRGYGARQPAQRENEQHARNEIKQR